ncbi:MAG TPA: hypothetical protein VI758_09205 [Bacteroidota bacterium]
MALLHLRFYTELNDRIPANERFIAHVHTFNEDSNRGQVIAGAGIPGSEVDLIHLNGESVDLAYHSCD